MSDNPNSLSALMPSFYAGLNKVAQEQTDVIDACNMNAPLEQAVIGQTITFPVATPAILIDTPLAGIPVFDGQTPGTGTLQLTKSKSASIKYNGEEIRQLQLGGIYSTYYADQMAQAVRALRIAIATDVVTAGLVGACRAVGTAGVPPFGTINVLSDFADPNKMFNDNGSPASDRHLILNTESVANIQGLQGTLFRANEAGTDKLLRTGMIGNVAGLSVGLDTTLPQKTVFGVVSGTPTLVNNQVKGDVLIELTDNICDPITGTPAAGDMFHIGSDTANVYVVKTYNASTPSITVQNPGLMKSYTSGLTIHFMTTGFNSNLFFTRDAITLIARQPLLAYAGPSGQLLDLSTVPDPRCGLTYQVAMWQNGRSIEIEVAIVWGVGVTNSQNLGILLG